VQKLVEPLVVMVGTVPPDTVTAVALDAVEQDPMLTTTI
jgi:hypothetical protein